MNLKEFEEKYQVPQKSKIEINCDCCGRRRNIICAKAKENIKRNGCYICPSCASKDRHLRHPVTEETKIKLRHGRLGKKHSQEAREKIRAEKKKLYQSENGKQIRKRLSESAAMGHASNKFNRSKRKGLFFSKKNGRMMPYNSSYELRLCWLLDLDADVLSYETQIYYEIDGRCRCLDFLVVYKDFKKAIEVKPKSRLTEQINIDQIDDSSRNAEKNGWEFEVYTEDNFGLPYKEIRDWADKYRTKTTDFDFVEHRKKLSRDKANRHYRKKIASDTVLFQCEYSDEPHTVLRKTYEENVKRNGRYICEHEGGKISGSKPKKKKENPYAAEGKKFCNGCKEIHSLTAFGVDNSKDDGLATRCKRCRAEKSSKRYQAKKTG